MSPAAMAKARAERRILSAHTEQRYRRLSDTAMRVTCQCGWRRDVISRRAAGDAVIEHKREQLRRVEPSATTATRDPLTLRRVDDSRPIG